MKKQPHARPIIVLGCGGHAKVLLDTLRALDHSVMGAVDTDPVKHGTKILGVPILGGEDWVLKHSPSEVHLVNGLGGVSSTQTRRTVFNKFRERGYEFLTLIHPTAWVGSEVSLGEGVQIMAGVRIQPGCQIRSNSIINTGATIDHDSEIGDHVHIAPGVTVCGSVKIGEKSLIGAGSTIIQKIILGPETLIGAGSLVIHSFESGGIKAFGVPAREAK